MTVLDALAALLAATAPGRRALVGVDGVDTSGKTTLADLLAQAVAPSRPVERLSVDDFLRPPAERYQRGRESPDGCYRDTFDHEALRERLSVDPARDHVLLVDGVFLQRPELDVGWDLVVHLQVPDEQVLRRAALRDGPQALPLYRVRYLPAQRLYEAECRPAERADVLLDNTDPAAPAVLRWPQ